jgi:branched-chain amino acid transport system substrate-binding protein
MKRKWVNILLISLVAILCFNPPLFGQPPKASPPSPNPIKIGGSLPLTGIYSELGKWIKAGYDFWVEDVNSKNGLLGRPVKMVIYDDESNADKAVTYYERAITVDKVDLLSGGYPGTANVAIMPLAEKYGKVFVGMGGHMKSFEQGFTYSFGSPPLMADWAYMSLFGVLDDFIPKADWPKSMAVLVMNNVIGISARGPFIKAAEGRGIKVVVDETYNLPLSDATPLVSKAKGKGAELFCCISVFDDGTMIMRTAKSMRYNPKIIWQLAGSKSPAWIKELGEDGNHVLTDAAWSSELPYPGNSQINQGAKERLKLPHVPDYFGLSYCWVKTLELAVQGAGTLDNTKIRDYLRSHTFDLPYGTGIKFDSRGLPSPFCFTLQGTEGRNRLVWPKNVATTKFVYPRPNWSK